MFFCFVFLQDIKILTINYLQEIGTNLLYYSIKYQVDQYFFCMSGEVLFSCVCVKICFVCVVSQDINKMIANSLQTMQYNN